MNNIVITLLLHYYNDIIIIIPEQLLPTLAYFPQLENQIKLKILGNALSGAQIQKTYVFCIIGIHICGVHELM